MAIGKGDIAAKVKALGVKLSSLAAPKETIVAIDIGSSGIKMAGIKKGSSPPKLESLTHRAFNLKDIPIEEAARQDFLVREIKTGLGSLGVKNPLAATSISGSSVIVREAKLPSLPADQLEKTLSFEAEPFIPFDIREVTLDYYIIGSVVDEGQNKYETILVAAKKDLIESRLSIFTASGARPVVVDIDAFAVASLLDLIPAAAQETVVVVNVGATITNLAIVEKGVPRVVRDVAIAGGAFTRALDNAFSIGAEEAEKFKKASGIMLDETEKANLQNQEGGPQKLQAADVLAGVASDLFAEINKSTDFYMTHGVDRTISRLYITGGGAMLKNLVPFAASQLKTQVELLNPFDLLGAPGSGIGLESGPMFAVACGLAMRRWNDWVKV
ncbi:MAG: type IV pilus assembly protein PilM [Elusimicrobia bacterium]|nr:type IV pilus assembly protein PilM [Elusimicrobiota bacterium]